MAEQDEGKLYFGRWSPAPRPDWVARINAEGEKIDARAVVPLDEQSLIDWAQKNTGLTDFGSDEWREPFRIFVRSIDEEGNLNMMGRIWARMEILNLLEARLRIEEEFRKHPEIADEQITEPIVIIGQGRSGTTALFNLLAKDPRVGVIRQWESMFPVPPPEAATYAHDPRIAKADDITMLQERITPEFAGMHVIGGNAPRECNRVQALTFLTTWVNFIGQCPTYTRYVTGRETTDSYRYLKKVMQLLQWRNPREKWVLKNPFHLDRLPELLAVFPDAGIVWPHRDPLRSLASGVSMAGTLQWQRSDKPFADLASWTFLVQPEITAQRFQRVIDWLEDGTLARERLVNIGYGEFIGDQLGTVAKIYRQLNFPLPEAARAAMQRHLDENPRDARPPHQYRLGDPEEVARGRAAFRRYQDYFAVPTE